jgi:D-3-phosphoglycerate dehydrogenase
MKVLIADKIAEPALEDLKQGGVLVDYLPEISPEELLSKIPAYDGLIVRSRSKVTQVVVEAGQKLKIVGRIGSGLDNIDLPACESKKIRVVNVPDGNSQAVAEHTIGLMIALLRHYPKAFSSMKQGLWLKSELSGSELAGKTVGILGYGHIGKRVGKILEAIGAKVVAFKRGQSLDEFFKSSDVVTVHLPLTPETKGMISGKLLKQMKPTSYLVNASRGEIIAEPALIKLIKEGKIAGAALDVFSVEPLPENSELRKLDNIILTPHLGASTKEALVKASAAVVKEFLS